MAEKDKVSYKSVSRSLESYNKELPPLYRQLSNHVEIIKTAKRAADLRALNREQIASSRTFKSLKYYLKKLDELEGTVLISDLPKFKRIADPLRESAYAEIVRFVELDSNLDTVKESDISSVPSPSTPLQPTPSSQSLPELNTDSSRPPSSLHTEEPHPELMSLQLQALEKKRGESDLRELEETAKSWNQLQSDIQDVAEIMTSLNVMVHTQGENIDTIEEHVGAARIETRQGLLELIQARRAKFGAVPFAGAVVGCIVGGPLGMLVGFKVAGVVTAALGSYVGYKSGAFVKNKMNEDVDSVQGGLEAPTLGAYDDDELTDDDCGSLEIKDSEDNLPSYHAVLSEHRGSRR